MKELETEFMELLKSYEECASLSSVIDTVGTTYQPGEQVFVIAVYLHSFWFGVVDFLVYFLLIRFKFKL